jgi:hypothetical protein
MMDIASMSEAFMATTGGSSGEYEHTFTVFGQRSAV